MQEVPDDDAPLRALSEILELGLYDARARLRATHSGPAVVATYASREEFQRRTKALRDARFPVLALDESEIAGEQVVVGDNFELTETAFRVSQRGRTFELPYAAVQLLLAATGVTSVTTQDTQVTHGGAGAVALGGLMGAMARRTKVVERTDKIRGALLRLYTADGPVVELRASALHYGGLGTRLQPTQVANFRILDRELKSRCTRATADNRLTSLPRTKQLLGPSMSTELHLGIALLVLSRTLRTAAPDPFRSPHPGGG